MDAHPSHRDPPLEHGRQFDVAIVGYGPVGQALAGLLGQAGHNVAVFERYAEIYSLPRAVHLDHEVMRILQALGVAYELVAEMHPISEYHWFGADGEPIFTLRNPTPARSGWEPDYLFFQPQLERALDRAARRQASVELYRGWSAEQIEQDQHGVTLTLARVDGGGSRTVSARYLIGADGANSTVREATAIACRDLGFHEQWLVVDVLPNDITALGHLPDACQWCDPRRPHMHARNGTRHRRWEFMLLPGESAADFERPARVWELLAPFLGPDEGEIARQAVYEFRSMLAERMRAGRVLLAGDAAHLTPPFMGQGLCSGLRDAINIAWKLDLVLANRADQALLDTIELERQPQNEWIINMAIEMGRVSCELDASAAAERDEAMRAAGELPPLELAPLAAGVIGRGRNGNPQPTAGQLGVQARVALDGAEGLLDEVLGRGFLLLRAHGDATAGLREQDLQTLEDLGFSLASLEQLEDLDGRLARWLSELGAHAVIVRPDFYVFGTAATPTQLPNLLAELRNSLTSTKETVAHA